MVAISKAATGGRFEPIVLADRCDNFFTRGNFSKFRRTVTGGQLEASMLLISSETTESLLSKFIDFYLFEQMKNVIKEAKLLSIP